MLLGASGWGTDLEHSLVENIQLKPLSSPISMRGSGGNHFPQRGTGRSPEKRNHDLLPAERLVCFATGQGYANLKATVGSVGQADIASVKANHVTGYGQAQTVAAGTAAA